MGSPGRRAGWGAARSRRRAVVATPRFARHRPGGRCYASRATQSPAVEGAAPSAPSQRAARNKD